MAALIILAGAMIHDRITEKKEAKRRKNLEIERNYRQLQAETARKEKAAVERNYESEDEKEGEPLPRYEDVTGSGEGSSASAATAPTSSSSNHGVDENAPPPGYASRSFDEARRHPGL